MKPRRPRGRPDRSSLSRMRRGIRITKVAKHLQIIIPQTVMVRITLELIKVTPMTKRTTKVAKIILQRVVSIRISPQVPKETLMVRIIIMGIRLVNSMTFYSKVPVLKTCLNIILGMERRMWRWT